MIDYSWKNTDPRIDIYKRARIVILRPSLLGGGILEAGVGQVETKNGYSILTDFENHSWVSEDEKWDEAWYWIRTPDKNDTL
jgi:hypothetical protein